MFYYPNGCKSINELPVIFVSWDISNDCAAIPWNQKENKLNITKIKKRVWGLI